MNLSYCRFQNTLIDFRDCVEAIESGAELSDAEADAASGLATLAERFANIMTLENDGSVMWPACANPDEALSVLRKSLAHVTRDYRPEDQALDVLRRSISGMEKKIQGLEGEVSVSHGMYSDLCDRASRLETHLRQVLEIARCWMPDYAAEMDREELELAQKEIGDE